MSMRARSAVVALGLAAFPPVVAAQGVPSVDIRQIAGWLMQRQQAMASRAAEMQENSRRAEILRQQDDQLAALDNTLALLTGTSSFIPGLEDGDGILDGLEAESDPAFAAAAVYAVEDANPYAGRLLDRKSTRLNSSHRMPSRMPSSA